MTKTHDQAADIRAIECFLKDGREIRVRECLPGLAVPAPYVASTNDAHHPSGRVAEFGDTAIEAMARLARSAMDGPQD